MNIASLSKANPPEPNQPARKPVWRWEAPRWCAWFLLWLILTSIPLCVAIDYTLKHKSFNVACLVLAALLTANYILSLAALVKAFTKEK
ncbi:MAG: hypothetical protein ACREFR_09960 [Limisphaerales bacterium]